MYYEATIKHKQEGKNVSDKVIVKSVSWTFTEATITAHMDGKEFTIPQMKPSKIIEVINPDGDILFKVVEEFISVDNDSGKEKKITECYLFGADNIDHAKKLANDHISNSAAPVEIKSIVETKIMEVL